MFCGRETTLAHHGALDLSTLDDDVVPQFQLRETPVDEEVTHMMSQSQLRATPPPFPVDRATIWAFRAQI